MCRDRGPEWDELAGTTGAVRRPPASPVARNLPAATLVALRAPRGGTHLLVRAVLPCAVTVAWLAWPGFDGTAWFAAVALGAMSLLARHLLATPAGDARSAAPPAIVRLTPFTLGWVLGATLFGAVAFAIAFDTGGVPFIAYGLVVALPQWLLLREHLRQPGWWLVVTAAIWPIAALSGLEFLYLAGPLGPLAGGFLVGAAQWVVLAAASGLTRAWTWVVASAIAWASAAWASMICAPLALPVQAAGADPAHLLLASLGVGAAGGLAYGVVSGPALAWLLGRGEGSAACAAGCATAGAGAAFGADATVGAGPEATLGVGAEAGAGVGAEATVGVGPEAGVGACAAHPSAVAVSGTRPVGEER